MFLLQRMLYKHCRATIDVLSGVLQQIGGELRLSRVHRDEMGDRYGLFLDLVLFWLAAPPLPRSS
jgi:hypothetical protein